MLFCIRIVTLWPHKSNHFFFSDRLIFSKMEKAPIFFFLGEGARARTTATTTTTIVIILLNGDDAL